MGQRTFIISPLERIKDKFLVGDGCWEWTAAKNTMDTGG